MQVLILKVSRPAPGSLWTGQVATLHYDLGDESAETYDLDLVTGGDVSLCIRRALDDLEQGVA